jgi:hypothetical protein
MCPRVSEVLAETQDEEKYAGVAQRHAHFTGAYISCRANQETIRTRVLEEVRGVSLLRAGCWACCELASATREFQGLLGAVPVQRPRLLAPDPGTLSPTTRARLASICPVSPLAILSFHFANFGRRLLSSRTRLRTIDIRITQ